MSVAERATDPEARRFGPLARSLLLHLAVFGALVLGTLWSARPPPAQPQRLAIEAIVVAETSLPSAPALARRPDPAPELKTEPTPAAEPEPLPVPDSAPEPSPQRSLAAATQRAAAPRAEREARLARDAQQAARRQAAAEREAAQRAAAQQAAADRAAAEQRAADARAAEEARVRAAREADLQRQLAAEEDANRARAAGQAASWAAAIQARIERAWIRPESARAGLDCTVIVNQVPGGEVTGVRITDCNGDAAVRQSIEAAVYRAAPLPAPPDPALFERTIEVRFRPHD